MEDWKVLVPPASSKLSKLNCLLAVIEMILIIVQGILTSAIWLETEDSDIIYLDRERLDCGKISYLEMQRGKVCHNCCRDIR